MTTSSRVAAKIAATSTKDTGITEDLAGELWSRLGHTFPAIVTLRVAERLEDEDGPVGIKLEIDSIEPSSDGQVGDYLQRLQRALYFERSPQSKAKQQALDGLQEPTPHAVINNAIMYDPAIVPADFGMAFVDGIRAAGGTIVTNDRGASQ